MDGMYIYGKKETLELMLKKSPPEFVVKHTQENLYVLRNSKRHNFGKKKKEI